MYENSVRKKFNFYIIWEWVIHLEERGKGTAAWCAAWCQALTKPGPQAPCLAYSMALLHQYRHWSSERLKMDLSQWDAGIYTLTCLSPKTGAVLLTMYRPRKIQIRIKFLSNRNGLGGVRMRPAAYPTQSPEPSLHTGSALGLSWRSSVRCVCVFLSPWRIASSPLGQWTAI